MARPLHAALFVVLSGCVIPPTLGVEKQDAGINSPPAITSIRSDQQELADGQTVTFTQGMGSLAMELLDTDVADPLSVRVYVDYNQPNPTPPRSTCPGSGNGTAKRTATCDLRGLCFDADLNVNRVMTVQVFDRMVLDTGDPLFKAMGPGGLTTSRTFILKCLPK